MEKVIFTILYIILIPIDIILLNRYVHDVINSFSFQNVVFLLLIIWCTYTNVKNFIKLFIKNGDDKQ